MAVKSALMSAQSRPRGGENARRLGDDDARNAELVRQIGRVQGARAPKADEREIARVIASGDRDHAQGANHVRVHDFDDTRGGFHGG